MGSQRVVAMAMTIPRSLALGGVGAGPSRTRVPEQERGAPPGASSRHLRVPPFSFSFRMPARPVPLRWNSWPHRLPAMIMAC